ncbi:hypothetical protein EAN97_02395 [Klebsiella pneumoniae]|nr:hypothetical protein EAN97_02395 [Klebsiella pneumoniae]
MWYRYVMPSEATLIANELHRIAIMQKDALNNVHITDEHVLPRFYVSTSKSIIKALINMHSFEIQLSPIG